MIKLFIITILLIFILYLYCKIKNTEYFTFKTELACIDHCILNNPTKCSSDSIDCKHNECADYCKKCDNDICIFNKEKDFEKSPPQVIDYPKINFFKDYIKLSWFKPETHPQCPILKYIITIQDDTTKNNTIQFIHSNNDNLVNYNLTGLKNNNTYNLKLFSENINGKSIPLEIKNLFYPSKQFVISNSEIKSGDNNKQKEKSSKNYIDKIENLFKKNQKPTYFLNLST